MNSNIPEVKIESSPKGLCDCPGFKFSATAVNIRNNNEKRLDLALIVGDSPLKSAGVFTTNDVVAAPVDLCKKVLSKSPNNIGGIVINSGNANACTGIKGILDAKEMSTSAQVSSKIGLPFYVCSTGRIGRKLPIDKISAGIDTCASMLDNSEFNSNSVSNAILTSDTCVKEATIRIRYKGKTFTIAGIAKGAGMIEPNMATMPCFIVTDLDCSHKDLQKSLSEANEQSFNCISIDGDMSTNDTVLILSNGKSEVNVNSDKNLHTAFNEALVEICQILANKIVSDGEKTTKVVTLNILGCPTRKAAEKVARSIGNSLLVKTSFYGSDPNWGRVIDAAGYAKIGLDFDRLDFYYDEVPVLLKGVPQETNEIIWKEIVGKKKFTIKLDLNLGNAKFKYITTDLSEDYVNFNKSE